MSASEGQASSLGGDLLILSNYYHPEPTGSAPPITDLSFWAAENGYGPAVLTARPSYPEMAVYPGFEHGQRDREVHRGVSVRRVWSVVAKSRGSLGRLFGESSFALSALLSGGGKYQGVVCVCPSIFTVAIAPLFRKKGGRVVCIVHDIQSGLARSLNFGAGGAMIRALQKLEAWSLNRCDELVVLTQAMEQEVRDLGVTRPISIIPPQVDVKEIQPTPPPTAGRPILLYSGNLGRKQGLDQVLDLAQTLQQRGVDAAIHIRGQGSERVEMEAEAAERGLANVTFMDLAPREELSATLGAAAIHLVPQNPAGASFALPSKIFSIMAAQRPYVATALPETPLHLVTTEAGSGLCVEPGEPAAFADAIERLLSDADMRRHMGASGRDYVVSNIDREVVCRRILRTLSGAVA